MGKLLKTAVLLAVGWSLLLVAGCGDRPPPTYQYIETPRGVISYTRGYCELGVLITNDGVNIRDENNSPITCTGYIQLTKEQVKSFGN